MEGDQLESVEYSKEILPNCGVMHHLLENLNISRHLEEIVSLELLDKKVCQVTHIFNIIDHQ